MTYHPDRNHGAPRAPQRESMHWGLPLGIAAVVFVAATIIFAAAGPDRTRTAQYDNLNSKDAAHEVIQPAESGIPPSNRDASEGAPAQTVTPQKSNPAGTR